MRIVRVIFCLVRNVRKSFKHDHFRPVIGQNVDNILLVRRKRSSLCRYPPFTAPSVFCVVAVHASIITHNQLVFKGVSSKPSENVTLSLLQANHVTHSLPVFGKEVVTLPNDQNLEFGLFCVFFLIDDVTLSFLSTRLKKTTFR